MDFGETVPQVFGRHQAPEADSGERAREGVHGQRLVPAAQQRHVVAIGPVQARGAAAFDFNQVPRAFDDFDVAATLDVYGVVPGVGEFGAHMVADDGLMVFDAGSCEGCFVFVAADLQGVPVPVDHRDRVMRPFHGDVQVAAFEFDLVVIPADEDGVVAAGNAHVIPRPFSGHRVAASFGRARRAAFAVDDD